VKDNHVQIFEALKLCNMKHLKGGYETWIIMVPNTKRQQQEDMRSRMRRRTFNEEGKDIANAHDEGEDGDNDNTTHDLDEKDHYDIEQHQSSDVKIFISNE